MAIRRQLPGINGDQAEYDEDSGMAGVGATRPSPVPEDSIFPIAQTEETPREQRDDGPTLRTPTPPSGGPGPMATPPMPRTPTPMAGAVSPASSGAAPSTAGVLPFSPMSGPSPSVMLRSPNKSLYGSLGGLTGGGLGVPLDPTSDAASDPISTLIKMLKGGR